LITAAALSTTGVCSGFIVGRVPLKRWIHFPIVSIVMMIVSYLLILILARLVLPSMQLNEPPLVQPLRRCHVLRERLHGGVGNAQIDQSPDHKRGTVLEAATARLRPNSRKANRLTLAGLPLEPADETKHFKLIGTTGTGNRELLAGVLERGDRAVVADPDGSYLKRFYAPQRGDLILNPLDPRAARWDLFGEMHTLYDADQLARSLIVDTEGPERNWRNYARVFLSSVLRQLHRVHHHDPAEL
jgi:hypothetical protein